jgi:S-methylmethionine-dependent homocysteine/selenocysteine methylase
MYELIAQKLDKGQTIILDGGTGTDIQRRGAPMSGDTWCAEANLTHPEIVHAVHDDYIRVGADIITANTFATSALLFNAIGRDRDLTKIDRIAVQIARNAAKGHAVAVAGSMSTMRPMHVGSDRNNLAREWPEAEARALFANKANVLAVAGVDMIMMELMRDTDYAVWATEAAVATGLPVWVGLSTERSESGRLQGWGRADCDFELVARTLSALSPAVMTVMHTSPNDTDEALEILRKYWKGPMGAYPECGYFKAPDWLFVDVISPDDLVGRSRDWQSQGVTIFGGCCGIGPNHIAALAAEFKS